MPENKNRTKNGGARRGSNSGGKPYGAKSYGKGAPSRRPNTAKKNAKSPDAQPKERRISKIIQWYPGHMAKARREITEALSLVDIAIELCDARIPASSRNPGIDSLLAGKPRILVMNKTSLADPRVSDAWREKLKKNGEAIVFTDCMTGQGISDIVPAVREILAEKLSRFESKGMVGRLPRAMILGVTNCGKSTLVNKLCGRVKAKAEDRPGVTRENKWITVKDSIELLDTPGILWPKFDDEETGLCLAFTGAIRDDILDREEVAVLLCEKLMTLYPELLCERYGLDPSDLEGRMHYEVFEMIGRKRGFLVSGGEVDTLRTAVMLLDEFRDGKIGRITLERPKA